MNLDKNLILHKGLKGALISTTVHVSKQNVFTVGASRNILKVKTIIVIITV